MVCPVDDIKSMGGLFFQGDESGEGEQDWYREAETDSTLKLKRVRFPTRPIIDG